MDVGDRVGIGGFIITGGSGKNVIIRAIGPSLTQFGIDPAAVLADPVLELHGPAGFTTVTNNNWRDTQQAAIQATGIPPTNDLESAIVATLAPGTVYGDRERQWRDHRGRVGGSLRPGAGRLEAGQHQHASLRRDGGRIVIAGFMLGNNASQ